MFTVVNFLVEDSVEVADSNWLVDTERVRWLLKKSFAITQRWLVRGDELPKLKPIFKLLECYHSGVYCFISNNVSNLQNATVVERGSSLSLVARRMKNFR